MLIKRCGVRARRIIILLLFFSMSQAWAATVGSNSSSSRQLKTFFPNADDNNKMLGFAAFENGFVLEDSATTCTFDAFFPISGDMVFNGGTLYLARDLVFKNPLRVGIGTINGQGNSIEFPGNISNLNIPDQSNNSLLSFKQLIELSDYVNSVDWAFDDQYVVVGTNSKGGIDEIKVYYFDGIALTETASFDTSNKDVLSVRWHPSGYYIAVGQSGDDELRILYFDQSAATISEIDHANIGRVNAVAWDPTGNYLAVGQSSSSNITIYEVSDGILGSSYTGSLGGFRTVQQNALDWDSSGNYIAVGLDRYGGDNLIVFSFNGSSVSFNVSQNIYSYVYAVSWHPTDSYLAIGVGTGSQRLILYEHASGSLTEKDSTGDSRNIYALDWSQTGSELVVGRYSSSDHMEVRIFGFDVIDETLHLITGYQSSDHVYDVRWSHNGHALLFGNRDKEIGLLVAEEYFLTIKDARCFFKSDVTFLSNLYFSGECVVNGGGHIITLEENAAILVEQNTSLILENMIIKGIAGNNIRCIDDTGLLMLRDVVWMQDENVTFSSGTLQFKNNVIMMGDNIFAYQAGQQSIILSRSTLTLDSNFTFSYDPIVIGDNVLLAFEDNTSKLVLDGATLHTTATGLQLTHGKLLVKRDSYLSSESVDTIIEYDTEYETFEGGITFGDEYAEDDFVCEILSGAALHLNQGILKYKNVNTSSFIMHSDRSILKMFENTRLELFETLDLGPGLLVGEPNISIARASGKNILGSLNTAGAIVFTNIDM